jgi:hypothetical protein
VWKYEAKMFGFTVFFLALAAFFFFVYGRRRMSREIGKGTAMVVPL